MVMREQHTAPIERPPFYVSNDGHRNLEALLNGVVRGLEDFRLLLGTEPQVEGDSSGLDLARYFQRSIQGDLEEMIFDRGHALVIDDLVDFLCREMVDVRLYRGQETGNARFLHAKAYIFPGISIVGSSNLTPAGLTTNAELNLVRTDREAADELRDWFESRWT